MISFLLFGLGFFLLWKGGEYVVDGASALARRFSISEIVIGLTLVSIGTSLPELVINIIASINDESDIVFGNIIGSNISNTLLILGLTGIIFPFNLSKINLKKEIFLYSVIVLFLIGLLFFSSSHTGYTLTFFSGIGLLIFCFISIYLFYIQTKHSSESKQESIKLSTASFYFVLGCVLLPLGGHWVVISAISIANLIGISTSIISLFAIALGTSLPELVTSVVAAKKKNSSLALGNIIGSNIFNITFVLATSILITPLKIPFQNNPDLIVLAFSTVMLVLLLYVSHLKIINKLYYYILFFSYCAYIFNLFLR